MQRDLQFQKYVKHCNCATVHVITHLCIIGKILRNCEIRNCVYQATVTSEDQDIETYVVVTKHFKQRFVGHHGDFRHSENRNNSTLASHIWNLKDENKEFNITWQIIDRGPIYNSITKKCFACIQEKYHIAFDNPKLYKRDELLCTCRHRLLETLSRQK